MRSSASDWRIPSYRTLLSNFLHFLSMQNACIVIILQHRAIGPYVKSVFLCNLKVLRKILLTVMYFASFVVTDARP